MNTTARSADLRRQFGDIDIYLFDQLLRGRFDGRTRVLDAGCGAGRNLPFFLAHLVDSKTPPEAVAKATVFETGTNRWRKLDAWPPAGLASRTLYLGADGRLAAQAPTGAGESFDEYVSDPSRPVPYVGHVQMGMQGDYMTEDQRFAATRPDVLLLDEPTTGLDYREVREMMDLVAHLNREGHAVVIVTHAMWVAAEYARRTIVMDRGEILADGPTRQVFRQRDVLARAALRPPEAAALAERLGLEALSPAEILEQLTRR